MAAAEAAEAILEAKHAQHLKRLLPADAEVAAMHTILIMALLTSALTVLLWHVAFVSLRYPYDGTTYYRWPSCTGW